MEINKFDLDSEELEAKLESKDLLETVTGSPSEQKTAKEEENKQKEKEEKIETPTFSIQQVKPTKEKNHISNR